MSFNNIRYLRDSLSILEECVVSKPKVRNAENTERVAVEKRSQILSDLVPFLLLNKRVAWKKGHKITTRESNDVSADRQIVKKRKRNDPDHTIEQETLPPTTTTTTTNTTTTTTTTTTIGENDPCNGVKSRTSPSTAMNRHQIQLKNHIDENRRLENKRRQLREGHKQLIIAYEYGLNQVSKLNDLTCVPDNIMKGNFPQSQI